MVTNPCVNALSQCTPVTDGEIVAGRGHKGVHFESPASDRDDIRLVMPVEGLRVQDVNHAFRHFVLPAVIQGCEPAGLNELAGNEEYRCDEEYTAADDPDPGRAPQPSGAGNSPCFQEYADDRRDQPDYGAHNLCVINVR